MPTDHGRRQKLLQEQYRQTEERKAEEARQASERYLQGLHRRIIQRVDRYQQALKEIRERHQ
jgi:hypothetical protein